MKRPTIFMHSPSSSISKIYFLILLLIFINRDSHAQKISVDHSTFEKWPTVSKGGVSNDGTVVFYQVDNYPIGKTSTTVKSISNDWKVDYESLEEPSFSSDSKKLYGRLPNDTLLVLDLKEHKTLKTPGVVAYSLFTYGHSEWIIIKFSKGNQINLRALNKGFNYNLNEIVDFRIGNSGRYIAFVQRELKDYYNIILLDLVTGKKRLIYNGRSDVSNLIFNHSDSKVSFIVKGESNDSIWFCDLSKPLAKPIVDENNSNLSNNVLIKAGGFWSFSQKGDRIFFNGVHKVPMRGFSNRNLIVWSYLDKDLHMSGLRTPVGSFETENLLYTVNLLTKQVTQLTTRDDEIINMSDKKLTPDDYIILKRTIAADSAQFRNSEKRFSYYLCETKTGKRIPLVTGVQTELNNLSVSPAGKYVIYYNPQSSSYYTFCFSDRRTRLIFDSKDENLGNLRLQSYPATIYPVGISGFLPDDEAVLINGSYNIWKVDPAKKKHSINLTGDLVKDKPVVYYLPLDRYKLSPSKNNELLAYGFDLSNKKIAFFNLPLDLRPYKMGLNFRDVYIGNIKNTYSSLNDVVVRSNNLGHYLFKFESANSSPNYWLTSDLSTFIPVSDIQPQKKYNWMISELHRYKDIRGNSLEGILYKPEDFDSTKKYPILLNFYEEKSNELNEFESPKKIGTDVDIAWLVSNGFLVFKANIFSGIGKPGEGALLSVDAAADYCSKFKWVEVNKMAIAGHSFGGYEVNYIVTHTGRYAAAVSAAGLANIVQELHTPIMGSLNVTWEDYVRFGPLKMVKPLSEDLEKYIENSPLFSAANIRTPLLMMHNPNDVNVMFSQGLSYFIELKNLKKKVWLLGYKGDGHGISDENLIDYYTRVSEFLDHYLKDKPMPDWMKTPNN